jgi:hypothetical protein
MVNVRLGTDYTANVSKKRLPHLRTPFKFNFKPSNILFFLKVMRLLLLQETKTKYQMKGFKQHYTILKHI